MEYVTFHRFYSLAQSTILTWLDPYASPYSQIDVNKGSKAAKADDNAGDDLQTDSHDFKLLHASLLDGFCVHR